MTTMHRWSFDVEYSRRMWDSNPRSLTGSLVFKTSAFNHSANSPKTHKKRETGIEPAIFALARRRTTTVPLAHYIVLSVEHM